MSPMNRALDGAIIVERGRMSENPRTGRFYNTLDALAGAEWFLASTWQADTGRTTRSGEDGIHHPLWAVPVQSDAL
ncbi:hypothetical protein T08_5179 [Trichinella sp. T8]|nr:hypothetical protein T08_5179 [Trichinella sp. T8]